MLCMFDPSIGTFTGMELLVFLIRYVSVSIMFSRRFL